METLTEKLKYDPWDAKQNIADITVKIHCARYWMLSEWECKNMSFPFWRLYHSRSGGSYVILNDREVELAQDKLILIPPYTPFSTRLKSRGAIVNESIKGLRISNDSEIYQLQQDGFSDQLFIHFNLGYPMDGIKSEMQEIKIDDYWKEQVSQIEKNRLLSPNQLDFSESIKVTGLILHALQSIPNISISNRATDDRIMKVISYIDQNIDQNITNNDLSNMVNLATSSFARLFKDSLKCSTQQYIQKKRIENAILFLHYSDFEIDEISSKCGFYDRHHFSKIFKKQTGLAPANYRKMVKQEIKVNV